MDTSKNIQSPQKELSFKVLSNPTKKDLEKLKDIVKDIFGEWDPKWLLGTLEQYNSTNLIYCTNNENQIVGFKVGYATSPLVFYSFIGGVLTDYRKKGLAKKMAKMQEVWCRKNSYKKLTTKSLNRFRPMIALNLKNEFNIIGTELDKSGDVKILFEKNL